MDLMSTWKATAGEMELSISPVHYNAWIKPCELESLEELPDNKYLATLRCPSAYHQHMIEQRYQGQLRRAIEKLTEKPTELAIVIGKSSTQLKEKEKEAPLFSPQQGTASNKLTGSHNLNPRLTFETYVVGSSNNFAHAAAQGVVKSPGRKYNPLFIYGGVGLGKTHLMHAVGHKLYEAHPDWKIMYISAETFGNDLIASLQSKKTTSFKKRYRSCDLLLVDDVQFIAGKEYTQEEFFHTFNELYMSERQIILTSDRPPQEIARIEERLSSRFMGGLTVDIQPPDYEMRVAILQQKNQEMGTEARTEAIALIAERAQTNIRELEGIFRKIAAMADTRGGELTGEVVREFFGIEKERRIQRVRPNSIVAKTAQYYEYKTGELAGKSRRAPLVHARHIAMYLIKDELAMPFAQIGEIFGGRDHTTVMHGVEKVEKSIQANPELAKQVADIRQLLIT